MTGIGQTAERDRPRRTTRVARLAALTLLAATAISSTAAAASIGIGPKVIENADALVSKGLYKSVGRHPRSVSCPADIPAKVGHVFTCKVVVNAKGQYVIATVTEASITGSTVHLDIADGTKLYSPS
jgi:hypothetical protein